MADLKNNIKADAVGYLYRAAFYLAKGDQASALNFLNTTTQRISQNKLLIIKPLLENPKAQLATKQQERYWAEKILDEYRLLFNQLS
ncbi:MAG: hypothetical protein ACOX50_03885 [Patescibacteria group bacterium]|jgi:hypothetical protein